MWTSLCAQPPHPPSLASRRKSVAYFRPTMRAAIAAYIYLIAMHIRKANCLKFLGKNVILARASKNAFSTRMVSTDNEASIQSMVGKLNNLISGTARGINGQNRMEIAETVTSLALAKKERSTMIELKDILGTWELMYTDDDLTRSSPFFWAFRKALRGIEDPLKIVGPKYLSDSIFKITDSIPFKSVGSATQKFSADENLMLGESMRGSLISAMELKVAMAGSSIMTTSSAWRTTEEVDLIEIEVEKTEVLESSVASLLSPLLNLIPKELTENLSSFPSGAALELIRPGSSTVYMRILYLDESLRVVKNEADGKFFIYGRSY